MLASPLMALIAAAHGTATVGQARQLGVVRGPAHRRVGVGGQPADRGHRQRVGRRRGVDHVVGQLRRDVAVQPLPRRRAGGAELGVQALFGLGHLVRGARGEATQRTAVLGDLDADRGQRVDAERADPVGEPGEQRLPLRRRATSSSLSRRLRRLVEAVGR